MHVLPLLLIVAQAAEIRTPEAAVERLLRAPALQEAWFAPSFLARVPFATLKTQLSGLPAAYGNFVRLEPLNGRPLAVFERGTLVITVATIDAQGRLTNFGAAPGPVPAAGAASAADVLARVFRPAAVDSSLFAASFLAEVPAATLRATFAELRAPLGAFVRVDVSGARPRIVFERGALDVTAFAVDAAGKITALGIQPASLPATFRDFPAAVAAFRALPGAVSLLVREVGPNSNTSLAALDETRALAVASAFKLAVLGELQAQVNAGRRRWTDEVALTAADKSPFTGPLLAAPVGTRYTLRDLAARMIESSDNTATDLLLRTVGRAGVEARLGQRAMPSTREASALKNPVNADLLRAYRAAANDEAARRAVLARAATAPLPTAAVFAAGPVATDVEWFVSTSRACDLLAQVAKLDETTLNPGLARKNDFARVSYKGGSEPGVLNLTTQVTNRAGKTYCVSATWNDAKALDDARFFNLYSGVLNLLR